MKKTRFFVALLLGALLSSCGGTIGDSSISSDATEVTIIHTNDTHGYLEGDGDSVIGIDQLATLHKSIENSILVDAGDATQGLPLASLTKGADVIGLMNSAGYDVMGLGNHEFDFGTENLLDNVEAADFPVLGANVYDEDGGLLLDGVGNSGNGGYTIIECSGKRIGFFGVVTKDTQEAVNPELLGDVTFGDEIEAAQKQIDLLREEDVDAIIAITHLGDETGGASMTSSEFALGMTGDYQDAIDVIIDAHSHTVEDEEVNGTLIVQTGSYMAGVGILTLSFEEGLDDIAYSLKDITYFADIDGDAETAEKLEEISESQSVILDETIAELPVTLWGGNVGSIAIARLVETNLGDLVADAFAYSASQYMEANDLDMPLIAVENAGGIRGALPYGEATMRDLVTAFPYSNTLYLKEITPKILYEMMDISSSYIDGQDSETGMLLQTDNSGGFLQISGFEVAYDATLPAGSGHVVSIALEGSDEVLDENDDETSIMLVSNNYIMAGGNSYTAVGELDKVAELGGELETVQDYLEYVIEGGLISEYLRPQGRITLRGDYDLADYTAKVQILDGDSFAAEGSSVSLVVDGTYVVPSTIDADGFVSIGALANGTHSIRIDGGTEEAYVDNYVGIGITEDEYRSWPTLSL